MTDPKLSEIDISEIKIEFDYDNHPWIRGRYGDGLVLIPKDKQAEYDSLSEDEKVLWLLKHHDEMYTDYELLQFRDAVIDWTLDAVRRGMKGKLRLSRPDKLPPPFDRTRYEQHRLFELAFELYLVNSKKRRTYSYKASLEDANTQTNTIDAVDFDRDFENINRNYTNWRKKKSF